MKKLFLFQSAPKLFYLLPLLFLFVLSGCETEEITAPGSLSSEAPITSKKVASEKLKTFYGPARHVGNGVARAYVDMNRDGAPESIGVRISEKALENLPQAMPGTTYTLRIPNQAAGLPFDHIDLNYNPEGHPHPDIYGFEHFDFHFYMVTEEEKFAMDDPEKGLTYPAKELWPEPFEPEDVFVPYMGTHWVDFGGSEFTSPGSFTKTFIYGSYDASFVFYEPMITVKHLEDKIASTNEFTPLVEVEEAGYYPTSYSIDYDSHRKEYVVSLGDMEWRE